MDLTVLFGALRTKWPNWRSSWQTSRVSVRGKFHGEIQDLKLIGMGREDFVGLVKQMALLLGMVFVFRAMWEVVVGSYIIGL